RWRLSHLPEVRFQGVVGCDDRGGDRHQDDCGGDAAPKRRHRRSPGKEGQASAKPPPSGTLGRPSLFQRKCCCIWFCCGHCKRILGSSQAIVKSIVIFSMTNTKEYRNTRSCITKMSRSLTAVNIA